MKRIWQYLQSAKDCLLGSIPTKSEESSERFSRSSESRKMYQPIGQDKVTELADALASELLLLGRRNGIPPRDLLVSLAMAEYMLHRTFCGDDWQRVQSINEEARATVHALTEELESN